MIRRLAEIPGLVIALAFAWKVALFALTMQPVPANDSYFYDGPVVNKLNGGTYCNPSIALALKISGTEVFSAYPPLYQGVLWLWMRVAGTSEIAAIAFHVLLFGLYLFVLANIFRRLQIPALFGNIAALFLFVITFTDRPDSLAQLLGTSAIYCWVRAREPDANRAWAWLMMLCVVLTLCTSLQLGGVYFCFIWLITVLNFILRREKIPRLPLIGTILIPVALIALVKFGFPRLWEGFHEHAAQTPAVTGLHMPRLDEILKVVRTVPGVCGASLLAAMTLIKQRRAVLGQFTSTAALVAVVAMSAVAGICVAALGYLSANFALGAAYLQPLVVAGILVACEANRIFREYKPVWLGMFFALALLGAIRAIGMSTLGVACATDVSQADAVRIVQKSFNETPSDSMVAVSAAYLYEAARHKHLRAIHSDWLAPGHTSEHLVNLIRRERPAKLVLTQFDYFRHFEGAVHQLQDQSQLVDVTITNTAHTFVPDSSRRWQKVVQHISWAPVIVELNWH